MFAQVRLRKSASALTLADLDAAFFGAFLTNLEAKRGATAKTRNLRLTAIRCFFRFVYFEELAHGALIQRVLAKPRKRHDKRHVHFLTRPDIEGSSPRPIERRGLVGAIKPCCWSRPRQACASQS